MATFFRRIVDYTRGIRFRLSLVYSGLFGLCLILLSLFLTKEYLDLARDDYDQYLRNFAIDLSNYVKHGPDEGSVSIEIPISEQIKFFPFVIQDTLVQVRGMQGNILYQNHEGADIPYIPDLAHSRKYTHRFHNFIRQDAHMRGLNLKILPNPGDPLILQVATSSESLVRLRERHFLFLLIIIPLTILISAIFAILIAGKALDPIRITIERVKLLLQDGGHSPLPVPDTGDEIEELARTFNSMLQQVQQTLSAQEQFVSHASHQLNTPLTIMRGELEVLRSKERTPEEFNRFHDSLMQELHRLSQLVKDMLLVSRVEAGREHFTFSPLNLDEVITETLERLAPRARERQVALRYDVDPSLMDGENLLVFPGERQLLVCLFENLIENAIKYSPSPSTVGVRLIGQSDGVRIEVWDNGPGPDDKLRQQLAHPSRFARGERTANVAGSGLGLYLAKKIADYHHAQLEISQNHPKGSIIAATFLR